MNNIRRTRFHKQLRKNIKESLQDFFIICPPGFEKECQREIEELFPKAEILKNERGGISLRAYPDFVKKANLALRTASRVLMRIGNIKAKNFYQLEKALQEVAWQLYFPFQEEIEINTSCKHCRLYHRDAINERAGRIFKNSLKNKALKPLSHAPLPALYIRGENDIFTLSIDSSGPLLHLRGLKDFGSEAPIRENLAAAILISAGYKRELPLIDPMCGSGTFSIEASLMANNIPPGSFRNFAWQNWPLFLIQEEEKTQPLKAEFLSATIKSSDISSRHIKQLSDLAERYSFLESIKPEEKDFFQIKPEYKTGLIVLNPPYGLRMQDEESAKSLSYKIAARLQEHWKGWNLAIILPKKTPFPLKDLKENLFLHGGLKMKLLKGSIR